MKVIEVHCNNWWLRRDLEGITLYPFIFYNTNSNKYRYRFEDLREHELTHIKQVQDIGFLRFYWGYLTNKQFKQGVEAEAYDSEDSK